MADKIDSELNVLIGRLSKVQKKVGGPEKAQVERVLGEDGKVDAFQDVKQQLKSRIENMQQLLDEVHNLKEDGQGKELITAQSVSSYIDINDATPLDGWGMSIHWVFITTSWSCSIMYYILSTTPLP